MYNVVNEDERFLHNKVEDTQWSRRMLCVCVCIPALNDNARVHEFVSLFEKSNQSETAIKHYFY